MAIKKTPSVRFDLPLVLLGLILLGYFLVAGLYAALTPAWQSPDEPAHYNYVRQIGTRGGCCPTIAMGDWQQEYQEAIKAARFNPEVLGRLDTLQYEDHQPPLYYLLARIWTPFPSPDKLTQMRLFSVLIGAGGVLCAYAVGRALLPNRPQIALAAAALVAFLPQHVHMLASVNNDGLAELIVGLTLLATIYYLQDHRSAVLYPVVAALLALAILVTVAILGSGLSPENAVMNNLLAMVAAVGMLAVLVFYFWQWLTQPAQRRIQITPWILGLLVGLGLVTKLSTLFLAGLVPLAILLKWRVTRLERQSLVNIHVPNQAVKQGALTLWRYRDTALGKTVIAAGQRLVPRLLRERLQPLVPLLTAWAVFLLPVLLLVGTWALRNFSVYGFPDVFGMGAHNHVVVGQLRTADLMAQVGTGEYLRSAAQTTFNSFWGQFGWMAAPMPTWAYLYILALLALAISGWVVLWWRFPPPPEPGSQRAVQRASVLLLGLTGVLAVLAYLYYNTEFVQFQGRYLYPGLVPFALALAVGVDGWGRLVFEASPPLNPLPITWRGDLKSFINRLNPLATQWRGGQGVRITTSQTLPSTAYFTLLPFLAFAPLDLYLLWRLIIPALAP